MKTLKLTPLTQHRLTETHEEANGDSHIRLLLVV